ncbi:peptidase inhibitor family I36 protein [Streptomyces sp. NPDC000594]|uniref:peptidase inhibitor family I36 protein n=1 Tax=Streptomyces sp. NPDC000594 TaxID=3154261 RepID=UPI00331FEF36
MNWKQRSAAVFSALALAGTGMAVSVTPAAAAGGCPAARLCIWDGPNFTGDRIASASTNACFRPYGHAAFAHIRSYSNNLPVTARVWEPNSPTTWSVTRTLPAGGFSSDIGNPVGAGPDDYVCMGSAQPQL